MQDGEERVSRRRRTRGEGGLDVHVEAEAVVAARAGVALRVLGEAGQRSVLGTEPGDERTRLASSS